MFGLKKLMTKHTPYMRTLEKTEKQSSNVHVKNIVKTFTKENKRQGLRVFVAGGSRAGKDATYAQEAFQLGQTIAKMGFKLDFGLSGRGIMGAVAKGVLKVWAKQKQDAGQVPIKGVVTKEYLALCQNDKVVEQIKDVIVAHTLEERKNQLLRADLIVFAPGGIGTLDELVYDCVAMQDGFLPQKPFIIFNILGFYHHILEYLKEIHLKGFSSAFPFIVVDDSQEAGVAFAVIKERLAPHQNVLETVQNIIYDLPYIMQEKEIDSKISIAAILDKMDKIRATGTIAQKQTLAEDIERAYLKKEIDRMYGRLEKTGHDTAVVTQKLIGLKAKRRKVKK